MLTATVRMIRRDHRPADRDRDRPAVVPRHVEDREAAGEDRDDRERDREVREPASSREAAPACSRAPLGVARRGRGPTVPSGAILSPPLGAWIGHAIKGVPDRPMDDATLSRTRRTQVKRPRTISAELSSDCRLSWANRRATPSRSRAGSPTAITGFAWAASDYVIRVPGKDTDLLGSTARRSATRTSAPPSVGVAPRSRRCSTTRRRSSPSSSRVVG